MPATIEESIIKIGDKSYKKRDVVAYLVDVGQFQELRLIYNSQIIYVCSNDPSSLNYKNLIFGETDPPKILEASIGNIQVLGGLSLVIPTVVIQTAKGLIFNVSNSFVAGNVIYQRNNGFGLSEPNDERFGAMLVLEANPTSIKVAVEPGLYKLPGHLLGEPGDLLFLEPPGKLTISDQVFPRIPLVRIHDADTILLLQASGG